MKKASWITLICGCGVSLGLPVLMGIGRNSNLSNSGTDNPAASISSLVRPRNNNPLPSLDESLGKLLGEQRKFPLWASTLRSQLLYAGPCDRPGAPLSSFWLYLRDADQPRCITLGEQLWLDFDPGQDTLRLRWATQDTGLIRAEAMRFQGDVLALCISKKNAPHESLSIEVHYDRTPREKTWEIGGHLVDTRLLMKMEGRWFGQDQLLTELVGPGEPGQHIQFGFGNRAYALPITSGGVLHWAEGRWHRGLQEGFPLLRVEGSDNGKLTLTVWDALGFAKTELSMPKLFSPGDLNSIANQLKFKGLRGQRRAQLMLGAQTLVAREGDWLIKKHDGWSLLGSPENRKAWLLGHGQGEVIVIQTIERRKGRPRVIAKIYNATHVESLTAECALATPPTLVPNLPPHP